jgi:hypothetical protein
MAALDEEYPLGARHGEEGLHPLRRAMRIGYGRIGLRAIGCRVDAGLHAAAHHFICSLLALCNCCVLKVDM